MVQLNMKHGGAMALVWIDLETTGADEKHDAIIELGAIMTDFDFNQIGEEFSAFSRCNYEAMGRLMYNDVVRQMHMQNGLLSDIINSNYNGIQLKTMQWMSDCINLDKKRGPVTKFRFMLAGSGVGHFDRRFIREQMPELDDLLVFAPFDIGNVRRFLKISGIDAPIDDPSTKNHRALDDVRMHLNEARRLKEWLTSV